MRQVASHLPAQCGHDFGEQRARTDTIAVLVTEDDQSFLYFSRPPQPLDSSHHIRQEEWVREMFEPRLQKAPNEFWLTEPAIQQTLREQRRDVRLLRQMIGERRLCGC